MNTVANILVGDFVFFFNEIRPKNDPRRYTLCRLVTVRNFGPSSIVSWRPTCSTWRGGRRTCRAEDIVSRAPFPTGLFLHDHYRYDNSVIPLPRYIRSVFRAREIEYRVAETPFSHTDLRLAIRPPGNIKHYGDHFRRVRFDRNTFHNNVLTTLLLYVEKITILKQLCRTRHRCRLAVEHCANEVFPINCFRETFQFDL